MAIVSSVADRSSVALRKESVDRNCIDDTKDPDSDVALRKESVDRNSRTCASPCGSAAVALRKESVDRNRRHEDGTLRLDSRSPQGERG